MINKLPDQPHEANLLKLDCSKAHSILNWRDVWGSETTFEKTVNWYKNFYEQKIIMTNDDLTIYVKNAIGKGLQWTQN